MSRRGVRALPASPREYAGPGRRHETYVDPATKKVYEIRFVDPTAKDTRYGGGGEPYFWVQVADETFHDASLGKVREWCREKALSDLPVRWVRVIAVKHGFFRNDDTKAQIALIYDRFWIGLHPGKRTFMVFGRWEAQKDEVPTETTYTTTQLNYFHGLRAQVGDDGAPRLPFYDTSHGDRGDFDSLLPYDESVWEALERAAAQIRAVDERLFDLIKKPDRLVESILGGSGVLALPSGGDRT